MMQPIERGKYIQMMEVQLHQEMLQRELGGRVQKRHRLIRRRRGEAAWEQSKVVARKVIGIVLAAVAHLSQ